MATSTEEELYQKFVAQDDDDADDIPSNIVIVRANELEDTNDRVLLGQELKFDRSKEYHELDMNALSVDFLTVLRDRLRSYARRQRIIDYLRDGRSLDDKVSTPLAAAAIISAVNNSNETIFEVEFNGRWYPVKMSDDINYTFFGPQAELEASLEFWGYNEDIGIVIRSKDFMTKEGLCEPRSVREILEEKGVRETSSDSIEATRQRVEEAEQIGSKYGTAVNITGDIFIPEDSWFGTRLVKVKGATKSSPTRGIIEGELEGGRVPGRAIEGCPLPYVRVFISKYKKYGYVELEDFEVHEYNVEMRKDVVLPSRIGNIMDRVFEVVSKDAFGDLFTGRHGGMVVMANGPSGVGKTLTAEVFAETSKRPLYVMEMGELGTNLANVEEALQRIFRRAGRWNAVLLFDEADIFLAKRDNDLERSAIVGVFLRLLDYYEGMFFLTTNRGDVIDDAMKSRITIRLDYDALTKEAQRQVWLNLLNRAGMNVLDIDNFDAVLERDLNGRQIRNQVRLLTVVHPNKEVTVSDIINVMQYIA